MVRTPSLFTVVLRLFPRSPTCSESLRVSRSALGTSITTAGSAWFPQALPTNWRLEWIAAHCLGVISLRRKLYLLQGQMLRNALRSQPTISGVAAMPAESSSSLIRG